MQFSYRTPTVAEYDRLRSTTNWLPVNKETTKTALENSLFSVLAIENDTVIGLGRIVGDGGLYFYIQDLIVHSEFRNSGIGKSLMNEMLVYIKKMQSRVHLWVLWPQKGLKNIINHSAFKRVPKTLQVCI